MIIGWVEQFQKNHDAKKILTSWWIEGKRYFSKSDGIYVVTNVRDPYIYAMSMMYILYGEPNYIHFKDAWVPVVHIVVSRCFVFNWVTILSQSMHKALEKAKQPNYVIFPTFHMASCLLNLICASNPFSRMSWFWNIASNPFHVYCQSLWENKYKKNYAQIFDNFFAPLYKLLFVNMTQGY
jgi:hypothetical protein